MHIHPENRSLAFALLPLLLLFAGTANAQSPFEAAQLLLDDRLDIDYPRALGYADLDGDGDLDAYGSPLTDYRTYAVENLGGGLFSAPIPMDQVPGSGLVWAMDHADIDGDGLQDLVFGSALGGAYYRLQTGACRFGAASNLGLPISNIQLLKTADLDADGDRDVLMSGYDGSGYRVYRMDHSGSGLSGVALPLDSLDDHIDAWMVADINADGYPELFAHSGLHDRVWWYPNRAGVLDPPQSLVDSLNFPQAMAVADTDGDGVMELLISSALEHFVWRMAFAGGDSFALPERVATPLTVEGLLPGDADGDGDVDLMLHFVNEAALMRNDGSGAFDAIPLWKDDSYRRLAHWVDVDGDGIRDWMEVTNARLAWRQGTAGGDAFGTWALLSLPGPAELAFGDIDQDGAMDVVNGGGMLHGLRFDPSGNLVPTQMVADYAMAEPLLFDADGDGWLDLATFTAYYVRLHRNQMGAFGESRYPVRYLGHLRPLGGCSARWKQRICRSSRRGNRLMPNRLTLKTWMGMEIWI